MESPPTMMSKFQKHYEDNVKGKFHSYNSKPYNFHIVSTRLLQAFMLNLKQSRKDAHMKKFLITLTVIVITLAALGGAGWVGYRYGYRQGIAVNIAKIKPSTANPNNNQFPPFANGNGFDRNHMPFHNFNGIGPGFGMGPGFHHEFGQRGRMMPFGWGFGLFGLIGALIRLGIFIFILWLAYKFFTGWRISVTPANQVKQQSSESASPNDSQSPNN
jgi:hypothetical protein